MENNKKTERVYIAIFAFLSVIFYAFLFLNHGLIDDGAFHIGRLKGLAKSISLSNLKPWIYDKTYYNLGYPFGVFYPDLFLYPFALLVKMGLSLYGTYIFMLMCINFFSALSMYYVSKKLFKYEGVENIEKLSFIVSLMYFAYPYRLWDVFFRMAVGESMAFIFLPLIVLGVYEIFYKNKLGFALFLGMTGIAYSHILSVVMVAGFLILYYLINIKKIVANPRIILNTAINAVFTILSTLMVTLPILEMQSFTKLYYQTGIKTFGLLKDHTLKIINNNIVSLIITIIACVVFLVLLIKAQSRNKKYLLIIIFNVYVCTSAFAWGFFEDVLPAINIIQFPWRLLVFSGIPFAFLCGKKLLNAAPIYISIVVMMWLSVMGMCSIAYIDISGIDLYGQYSIGQGEYLTASEKEFFIDGNKVEDVYKKYDIKANGNEFEFKAVDSANGSEVVIPKGYYKGYEIKDTDGNTYSYEISDEGMIKIVNPKTSKVSLRYVGTLIQRISLIISFINFVGIICLLYYYKRNILFSKAKGTS